MQYLTNLDQKTLDRLIDVLNAADDAQQSFIDTHRSGEFDATTEALYESTYELCNHLQNLIRNTLAPQVAGLL